MAYQADHYNRLAKVGREGFALLEELDLIRRPKKSGNRHQQPPKPHDFHQHQHAAYYNNYQHELDLIRRPKEFESRHQQPPQPHDFHQPAAYIYRGPQIITVLTEPVIDCNQAAQLYGGMVFVDHHSTRKPIPNGGN